MSETAEKIALTKYAHGAGCGCKIAPHVLSEILTGANTTPSSDKLLVGNSSNDDAAVYDLGNGSALVSTTDFFMPIVDDAYDFGRVAAANAISDVYAMGGQPLLALAILGWPVDKLPASLASRVMDGAREVCSAAGIPLAGGHSVDTPEPLFGLAVNGLVNLANLKRNNTAREGDVLFLTKPLGTGVVSTAQKRGLATPQDLERLVVQMTKLNNIGIELGKIAGVNAITDVTGFGLLGHLVEMAQGSGLTAEINYSTIPKFSGIEKYLQQNSIPDATYRNWNAYSKLTDFDPDVDAMQAFQLLPDPQTNGGLLISVAESAVTEVQKILTENNLAVFATPIGRMAPAAEKPVRVKK